MSTDEKMTLDRYTRTAAQVALTAPDDDPLSLRAEDRAVERCAALLTPRARLELAVDLLRGLPGLGFGRQIDLGVSDAAVELLRSLGAQMRTSYHGCGTSIESYEVAALPLGSWSAVAQSKGRPVTLRDDAMVRPDEPEGQP